MVDRILVVSILFKKKTLHRNHKVVMILRFLLLCFVHYLHLNLVLPVLHLFFQLDIVYTVFLKIILFFRAPFLSLIIMTRMTCKPFCIVAMSSHWTNSKFDLDCTDFFHMIQALFFCFLFVQKVHSTHISICTFRKVQKYASYYGELNKSRSTKSSMGKVH